MLRSQEWYDQDSHISSAIELIGRALVSISDCSCYVCGNRQGAYLETMQSLDTALRFLKDAWPLESRDKNVDKSTFAKVVENWIETE